MVHAHASQYCVCNQASSDWRLWVISYSRWLPLFRFHKGRILSLNKFFTRYWFFLFTMSPGRERCERCEQLGSHGATEPCLQAPGQPGQIRPGLVRCEELTDNNEEHYWWSQETFQTPGSGSPSSVSLQGLACSRENKMPYQWMSLYNSLHCAMNSFE